MPPETPPDDARALRIQLLGAFRLWAGGRLVPERGWRLQKAKALVKLLALAPGHSLHREVATELLWPDLAPRASANNLKQALHCARRALRPVPTADGTSLHLQRHLLVLRPAGALWIDVEAFEAAAANAHRAPTVAAHRAALELYGGDLLPEDRFEDWAASRREALRRTYLELLEDLAGLCEARGDRAAAVDTWRRLVAAEPTHEEGHARLMRLLAQAGCRHQALRQYHQLCAALQRELDTVPEAAIERLHEDIHLGRFPAT